MENKSYSSQYHDDGSITIHSGGQLTIDNVFGFATCLGEALASSQRVEIAFDANVEMDLTALQVLCSACKTAAAEGKTLSHQGADIEAMRQLIIAVGAGRHGSCTHNNSNPCAWFGGTH